MLTKIRSVLNMPAHVSRISTADLYKLHDIQDPVQAIIAKLRKRLRKLLRKTTRGPDITTSPHVVQVLRDKIHQIETLPEPEGEPVLSRACQGCGATFETQRGLHLHRTVLHPSSIERFIPSCFDMEAPRGGRHATVRGLPDQVPTVERTARPSPFRGLPHA